MGWGALVEQKVCRICGRKIKDERREKYCVVCLPKNRVEYTREYNHRYYQANWRKWYYRYNRKIGTRDFSSRMRRTSEGKPDFEAEKLEVKRELESIMSQSRVVLSDEEFDLFAPDPRVCQCDELEDVRTTWEDEDEDD